jgi:hypothetical protein
MKGAEKGRVKEKNCWRESVSEKVTSQIRGEGSVKGRSSKGRWGDGEQVG